MCTMDNRKRNVTEVAFESKKTADDVNSKAGGGIVNLLWTGGFDSTFRLIELSRINSVVVQPIYMYGDGRPSAEYERDARQRILKKIHEHPETKADILPVKEVDLNSIPQNPSVTVAYKNITEKYRLGSQYEWIARYAFEHPGCELCSEKPHPNGIGYMQRLIEHNAKVVTTGDIHNYKAISESKDIMLIIGNVYFPIKDKTELDMLDLIKKWGYEDIIKCVWFCFTPIKGKPCGFCRPCSEKIESDMGFMVGDPGLKHNSLMLKYEGRFLFRAYRHFLFKFWGIKQN